MARRSSRKIRRNKLNESKAAIPEVKPEDLLKLVSRLGFNITDTALLPARQGIFAPICERLPAALIKLLCERFPQGLYRHQAEAINAALEGKDICLATSTASGKSLVFMSMAAHLLERERCARVLALYPARALIQDQKSKWDFLLQPLSFRVGCIDGSIPVEQRISILRSSRVVLMTPDVAHAWLLSHLSDRPIAAFLGSLSLLVLDEAHVYDGVFGTNMAYFLRRLECIAHPYQMICCTATLGKPTDYLSLLTGRSPLTFGPAEDCSNVPQKKVHLLHGRSLEGFDDAVSLLRELAKAYSGRFLAFGDSRKMVELLVAAVHRERTEVLSDPDEYFEELQPRHSLKHQLLPYRAGYEAEDRQSIQQALARGTLRGVVSTSAMELGLDIGEIDLVVLLNTPPTIKAFWQRVGRSGRVKPSICLFIDTRGVADDYHGGLAGYLGKAVESNWLYLDNRYIQYTNALCAAAEIRDSRPGLSSESCFSTLPSSFLAFLENEINPSETIPPDLYPLKQKGQANPHWEFPIRCGIEQEFSVKGPFDLRLGSLTLSQVVREAYPGAIYHYLARPYRVRGIDSHKGEIRTQREKHWTTKPLSQVMVFPNFKWGVHSLYRSPKGFVAEVEVQISERVIGFSEKRGSQELPHLYGPDSEYSQRGLSRFFATTGVCWSFIDPSVHSNAVAHSILEVFCQEFGVQERDVGCGCFFSKSSPLSPEKCQGACVYDATNGSLRLTKQLAENFHRVMDAAITGANSNNTAQLEDALKSLKLLLKELELESAATREEFVFRESDWRVVIAPEEQAMYVKDGATEMVTVIGYRYTPQGLMYQLKNLKEGCRWLVAETSVQPLHGLTRFLRVNLVTGEEQAAGE